MYVLTYAAVAFFLTLVTIYWLLRYINPQPHFTFLGWLSEWGGFLVSITRLGAGSLLMLIGLGFVWLGEVVMGEERTWYLPEDRPHH